jgi:hypothetical protein
VIEAQLEKRYRELDKLRREGQSVIGRMKALLDQDVTVKVDVQHNEPVTISSAASKSSATATAKTGVAAGSGS